MANNLGRLHEAELWLTSAVNADSENRAAHYWRSKVYEARYYKEREKLPGQKTRKERKSIKEEAEKCWKLSREDKKMAEGLVPYY
ncbi:MAG: hypothetical protein NT051_00825 [Candidatus Micrarchaeota archaeon]|nr:hypothetical protein [Candidatus Micrarchaeota archaeon]